MIDKVIRRMIIAGYSDEDIVTRLRVQVSLVTAIRDLIVIENNRSHIKEEDGWDEYE